MPGMIHHSPEDIVSRILIAMGVGTDPEVAGTPVWPVYVGEEPSTPDNVVTIYGTRGREQGVTMVDGEVQEDAGIQGRIRSELYNPGYERAQLIATTWDQVKDYHITVDGHNYKVIICNRGPVLSLGKQVPKSQLFLFTVNALASVRAVT